MNLKPLGDRVVVEPAEAQEKTAGGVFLPDTAKQKPSEGIVRAVGPGRLLDNGQVAPMHLKVGDRVIYSKYSGSEVKMHANVTMSYGGVDYLIISEKDILAVFDNAAVGV